MAWVARVRAAADDVVDALSDVADELDADGTDVLVLFRAGDETGAWTRTRDALDRAGIAAPIAVEPAEMLDWDSVWRRALRPFRVGPLTIAYDGEPGDDRLVIDVGAFGTGRHPTTRLCLDRLAERPPAGAVLDVGAGNGVLALAALRLGATRAVGTDTDPAALAVAATNAARNGLPLALASELPDDRFALVLANLAAAPVVDLAPWLLRRLGPGGEAALSGFTVAQVPAVARAWRHIGARVLGHAERDGWARLDVAAPW